VHRVVCAVDCGLVVNRSGAEAQVEGGIMDALGAALYGEITVKAGQVEQRNFDRYRLLRMKEAPVVEVHFVTGTPRPTGLGEPPVPAGAAAAACSPGCRSPILLTAQLPSYLNETFTFARYA
jgi:isoquinoline 1-oxidoreductase beta subunit